MRPLVSVVLPTHNPRLEYLRLALDALEVQTLSKADWTLVVVDNGSTLNLAKVVDLRWHPSAEVIREETIGLTRARLAGFHHAPGQIVVLVDDDNVLAPDYLEKAEAISREFPHLGAWGGGIVARFDRADLAPPRSLFPLLTLRDVHSDTWSNDIEHHASTPWGAGLCLRGAVVEEQVRNLALNPGGLNLDLQGSRRVYGGDSDLAYTACRMGMGKGVFRLLQLEHLIPASRCSASYLARVAEGRGYSEVLHHWVSSGEVPERERSLGAWLRAQRSVWRGNAVERRVARALLKGRRRAHAELSKSQPS